VRKNETRTTVATDFSNVSQRILMADTRLEARDLAAGAATGLAAHALTAAAAAPCLTATGLTATGLAATGLAATGLAATGLAATGLAALGLAATGLTATGLAATGLAATGLAATGLAATGLAATGLAATGLAATDPPDASMHMALDEAALAWRPAAAQPPHGTAMEAYRASAKRTVGDRQEQFQSALELPPAKSAFNLSQEKEDKKQGNHPYG
jgi:hypothetical protein